MIYCRCIRVLRLELYIFILYAHYLRCSETALLIPSLFCSHSRLPFVEMTTYFSLLSILSISLLYHTYINIILTYQVNLSCNFFKGSFDIPRYIDFVHQYWVLLSKLEVQEGLRGYGVSKDSSSSSGGGNGSNGDDSSSGDNNGDSKGEKEKSL